MNNTLFTGACTALVTPFLGNQINFPLLERLIRRQCDAGIRAIVISGTTGESPTLSDREKLELFAKAKQYARGEAMIIAGTGSNCTEHAMELSRAAADCGADALLVVSPYYNKATADGLAEHFAAIALNVKLPMIVYNVPSRTGVDIPVSVYRQLSKISNIAGVKEASADIGKVSKIKAACPDFAVWSGNDEQIVPVMALGGSGVISVLSNVLPVQTQAMCRAALDGDFDTAADLQVRLLPVIEALFSEVNPIPVKAAMKCIGYDCGVCRMPLTPIREENYKKLEKVLSSF